MISPNWRAQHRWKRRGWSLVAAATISAMVAATGPLVHERAVAGELTDTFEVDAQLSHHGQVELFWDDIDVEVASWTVHRGSPDEEWQPSAANQLATVGEYDTMEIPLSLSYGDFSVAAHTTYAYEVVARDHAGNSLADSERVTIDTEERDNRQEATVFYSYILDNRTTQLKWQLPAHDTSSTVTVFGKPSATVPRWREIGTYAAEDGGVALTRPAAAGYKHFRMVSSTGTSESVARLMPRGEKPRLMLSDERVAQIREQIAVSGSTHAKVFEEMLADIGAPERWAYPNEADPRINANSASYAALAYVLTGDEKYADIAFDQFMITARFINNGQPSQPLFAGAYSTDLALTYDWIGNGWSESQRDQARSVLLRLVSWWTTTHYINDLPEKSSNWVGITRGGEAVLRMALLGEPGYVDDTSRFALVVDELVRHLDDGFSPSGYTEEGGAYWIYGMREVVPAIRSLETFGMDAAEDELDRHDWESYVLHTQSSIAGGYRTQSGVGPGRSNSHQHADEFVSQALALADADALPAVRWLYDRVTGSQGADRTWGGSLGRDLTLLYYPADVTPANPAASFAPAARASLDDEAGAYLFRNEYNDADDVLVGTFNRNTEDPGWGGLETFGLPILSHDNRWTVMAAKGGNAVDPGNANTRRMSKPLVDGLPEIVTGEGRSLASWSYSGQSGGYVELDASGNYQVSSATRSMAVDMAPNGQIDTTIAIHDAFADDAERTWTWQLAGLRPTIGPDEDGLRTFAFRQDGAWLKGWVIAEDDATLRTDSRLIQVETTGTSAEFRVVLAVGDGPEPTASREGSVVTINGTHYDLDDLRNFQP